MEQDPYQIDVLMTNSCSIVSNKHMNEVWDLKCI